MPRHLGHSRVYSSVLGTRLASTRRLRQFQRAGMSHLVRAQRMGLFAAAEVAAQTAELRRQRLRLTRQLRSIRRQPVEQAARAAEATLAALIGRLHHTVRMREATLPYYERLERICGAAVGDLRQLMGVGHLSPEHGSQWIDLLIGYRDTFCATIYNDQRVGAMRSLLADRLVDTFYQASLIWLRQAREGCAPDATAALPAGLASTPGSYRRDGLPRDRSHTPGSERSGWNAAL